MKKYPEPQFVDSRLQVDYRKWLYRKASSLLKRDRGRGNTESTPADYRDAIHKAASDSKGKDYYTGEDLDWNLISQYNNEDSKKGGSKYKKKFALLPSVDHVDSPQKKNPQFKICGWRTNDAKNDLSCEEFVVLCERVLKYRKA